MNVVDEHSRSYWMEAHPSSASSPLDSDQSCDVVVVGAGIAGLSTWPVRADEPSRASGPAPIRAPQPPGSGATFFPTPLRG